MICYVHYLELGYEVQAVATCKSCGVGLCFEHLAERQLMRPGGMNYGCAHVLPTESMLGTTGRRQDRRPPDDW